MSGLGKIVVTIRKNGLIILFLKLMERQRSKYFFKLVNKKKWYQASYIGERLIALYPDRVWYYRKLIECYQYLKDDERAKLVLKKYINLKYNSFSSAMEEIENNINSDLPPKWEYIWLGGHQNNGFIEHTVENKKYLTKISSSVLWREKLFYLEIYSRHESLRSVTPKMVSLLNYASMDMDFITLEKIEGIHPEFEDEVILEVIKNNFIVSSIKYNEIKGYFTLPKFKSVDHFNVINRGNSICVILRNFNDINKEIPNRLIFSALFSKMDELNYSSDSIKLIRRIENMVFNNRLFEKIKPDKHFTLRHGDLTANNMIIDSYSGVLLFLDWGNVRIGPSWFDIAGFLGLTKRPFQSINTLFLQNECTKNRLDPIEKFFFMYTLVIIWFNVLSKEEFDQLHHLYIRPAAEYMEQELLNNINVVLEK